MIYDPETRIDNGANPGQIKAYWDSCGNPNVTQRGNAVTAGTGWPIVNGESYQAGGESGGAPQPELQDGGDIDLNRSYRFTGESVLVAFTAPATGVVELAVAPQSPQADQVIATINGKTVQAGGGAYVSVPGIQVTPGSRCTMSIKNATVDGIPMIASETVQLNG